MFRQSISTKRNLLYEMIIKLAGLEKRIQLSEEEINGRLSSIQKIYEPFYHSFTQFLKDFLVYIDSYIQDSQILEKIENKEILETIYEDFKGIEFQDIRLKESQVNLLKLLSNRIQQWRLSIPAIKKEQKKVYDIEQLLQYLLTGLNTIDKKLGKISSSKSEAQLEEFNKILEESRNIIAFLTISEINTDNIEELIQRIKRINNILGYKKASFSFAIISRNFKSGGISLQRFQKLLKTKIRAELIRAIIILILKTYGPLSLEQMEEKIHIETKDLLKNCIVLLDRKELTIITQEQVNYFDVVREYPQLYQFISKKIRLLEKNLQNLSVLSKSLINVILSISNQILEKILKLGAESDKIYDDAVQILSNSLNGLENAFKSVDYLIKLKEQRERIGALIELYNMYRIKMVHEKEPYLIEDTDDKDKRLQLKNFLSNTLNTDFERGLVLAILRDRGALTIRELAELTNLSEKKLLKHILRLEKKNLIINIGTKNNYFIYDVPRTLAPVEKRLQDIFQILSASVHAYLALPDTFKFDLELLRKISKQLHIIRDQISKLHALDFGSEIRRKIQSQLDRINILTKECIELDEILPKTRRKFDLTKLATIPLPHIDTEYADLMDPKYLVGFGDIEWDIRKCLACASCQEICPETAVYL
ncbi:MAG: winged helix-turn-helix domain-containing protein, partial [Candidatus Helarchaeota archaeon]